TGHRGTVAVPTNPDHVALTRRVKTFGTRDPGREVRPDLGATTLSLLSRELVGRPDVAVAARFSFRELCFGRERVERTLERKPAAMAELEGRPGQRRLTETAAQAARLRAAAGTWPPDHLSSEPVPLDNSPG